MVEWKRYLKGMGLPVLCAALAVVALLGVMMARGEEEPKQENGSSEETVDTESFRSEAVRQLQELISKVEGAGEVQVMVTVETTPAKVYAEDVSSSYEKNETEYTGNSQSTTVFSQEEGREKAPVLLYRTMPRIGGVAVVCQGAGDPQVCLKITRLVAGLYGIGTNRICVTN